MYLVEFNYVYVFILCVKCFNRKIEDVMQIITMTICLLQSNNHSLCLFVWCNCSRNAVNVTNIKISCFCFC
jgi:hypothetical protein